MKKLETSLSAIDTIAEAIALLRRTPALFILCSFIGSAPVWLGLLFFITDMAYNAYAGERLAGASLGLVVLYLWKKCWDSVFALGLRARLGHEQAKRWTWKRVYRLIITQANIHFFGLIIRPIAWTFLLPTVWTNSFYQCASVLGDGSDAPGERSVASRAWEYAKREPVRHHQIQVLLSLFTFFVWLNVFIFLMFLPDLLKMFFGVETMASRNKGSYANTTFVASTAVITMLLMDPVWRAIYVVRCFHADAVRSGADIRARLLEIRGMARAAALALVLLLLLPAMPANGAFTLKPKQTSPAPQSQPIDSNELDRSISNVLERREFAWRSPRKTEESKENGFQRWMRDAKEFLGRQMTALFRFFRKLFTKKESAPSSTPNFEIPPMETILYITGGIVVAILAWLGWQMWRTPRKKVVVAQAIEPVPDLLSPDTVADQLPEEGWLKMARDLAARGELRLALRAAYLASLAYLGEKQLVSIARYKSDRDYQRELRRRARPRAELLAVFDENLGVFEGAWYGEHPVTQPAFEQFTQNLERMRAC